MYVTISLDNKLNYNIVKKPKLTDMIIPNGSNRLFLTKVFYFNSSLYKLKGVYTLNGFFMKINKLLFIT